MVMTSTQPDLGPVGVTLTVGKWDDLLAAAPELEELGYSTIWASGGQLTDLDRVGDLVAATRRVPVATAVVAADRFDADQVARHFEKVEARSPGRLVLGLGGAHGPRPLAALGRYLDRLDGVPRNALMLAALGPRMLDLARDRTAGAVPQLATPAYTASARERLGAGSVLAVHQLVVLESDPARARAAGREVLGFLTGMAGYRRHLGRIGFTEGEIERLDDRLVDAVVAWGDAAAVAARVAQHRDVGADHVALTVLDETGSGTAPVRQWRELAGAPGR